MYFEKLQYEPVVLYLEEIIKITVITTQKYLQFN